MPQIKLHKIASYISRNDCLSEQGIYNFENNSSSGKITVLSGASENIFYGVIPHVTDGIHFLDKKQGLHIVTRGKAGQLTYLPKSSYAANTNAFIIYLKDDQKEQLSIITDEDESYYLKFLKIFLEPKFLEISSNSDVSVFPLTKVFEEFEIPHFILNDNMKDIVNKYEKINLVKNFLFEHMIITQNLLDKEII